jgi:hypothetical protein
MKMNLKWSVLLCACCSLSVAAQTVEEQKQRIAEIKKDNSTYLYADVTDKTEEDALKQAESDLLTQVKAWLTDHGKESGLAQQVSDRRSCIALDRGNQKRAFLYIRTSDIASSVGANATAANTLSVPTVIREIAACTRYEVMAEKIQTLKQQGRLKSYARYASLPNPETCYLFIYDRAGNVVATLTPGSTRKNIATNEVSSVAQYKGCGAIGVEVAD